MLEQELDRYWKTVVNTIQDGLMIVDKRGTVVSVNKALEKISGYSTDELIGKPCTVLNCDVCEKARRNQDGHWCVLFESGTMSMRRCTILKKDQSVLHAIKNASLLHDDSGNVIGAVETITDISEIIEKDKQLKAYRKSLDNVPQSII